ncbi:PREDICTED: mucolipin-3-like [Amphimedon queenslandica]|uniref:Uncharacterized protein n=1 Tax=Amphimedon queenslandica TaxID=400682 RepID=A0A1X7VCY3_AMPQE|nr:PREDICTED: mucolipin-3-like [Amphimedon queenslandica]|eukprot:XP_011402441.1 PREDICTED: mucolipin-3-like [Amphimedon queenslandica]
MTTRREVSSEGGSSRTASPLNIELLPPTVSVISCSSEEETPINVDTGNRAATAPSDLRVQQSVTFSDISTAPFRHLSDAASMDSAVSTSPLTSNGGRRTGVETIIDGSISFAPSREKLKHLKSRLKLHDLSQNELELKAALYFHICNPLKRWKVEKLVPYKLVLQVIKTFLLVAQVLLFAYSTSNHRSVFLYNSGLLFDQLLSRNTSIVSYGTVRYSYTQSSLTADMDHLLDRYYQLPNITLGSYGHQVNPEGEPEPVRATLVQFKESQPNPTSPHYYSFDYTPITTIVILNSTDNGTLTDQLYEHGMDLTFVRFISLELQMSITGVLITDTSHIECYLFYVKVLYQKESSKGRISYHLKTEDEKIECNGDPPADVSSFLIFLTVLDVIVIIASVISTGFICHTLRRSFVLAKAMGEFYESQLGIYDLSWFERKSLFSIWHIFTGFSDLLLIIGTLLKILLEYEVPVHSVTVRILIGTALIVQSSAMLRYFSFFKQLNALTRTLSAASPELIKFLFCTSILYFAYALCGLVVFGSYNEEMFGNFGNSVEILFALINGDSIWLIFRAFNDQDILIYIYSRLFVYLFIFLFIYAVLNLFTSLVKTAYDNSSLVDRATINEVRRFVFSGPLTDKGVALKDVTYVNKYVKPEVILKRKKKPSRTDSRNIIGDLD